MSDRGPSKRNHTITLRRVDAATIDFVLVFFSCNVMLCIQTCSSDLRQFIDRQITQQTPKVIQAITLLQLIVRQAPNL